MNLIGQFLEIAKLHPDKDAVIESNGKSVSFGELANHSAGLAENWRSKGIGKGDRVLLAMPIGTDLYAAIAALWRLGATIVFPEPAMGYSGLRHAARMTRPKAVLTFGWYRILPFIVPELWNVPVKLYPSHSSLASDAIQNVEVGHPALISFTSGSTGEPKGIIRSHGFLAAQNACVSQMLVSDKDEIDLVAFPVFVIANLGLGVTSVLPNWKLTQHDKADASAIIEYLKKMGITRALIPPSICEILTESKAKPLLKTVFTGGGPIFPDLIRKLEATLPKTTVMAVYGSTEAEPIAHLLASEISEKDWNAMETGSGLLAGEPIPEIEINIMDDEIVVTGDHVNKSYLDGIGNKDNKIEIGGKIWHRTGDAGRLDENGKLWLRGRLSAKAGDYFPFEIEVAARCWEGVSNVALVPDTNPPCLAIAGDNRFLRDWEQKAEKLGKIEIRLVPEIPMDRRHHSKVDYGRLGELVR
ncbi:MAG: AMP-binding protein [Rhizobiaceae bacterium]|nr:AMP-binding protein [Rhizobiaceae bacterium]